MDTPPAGPAPVPAPTAEPKVVSTTPAQPDVSSLPAKDSLTAVTGAKNRLELKEATEKLLSAIKDKPAAPKEPSKEDTFPADPVPTQAEKPAEPAPVPEPEVPAEPEVAPEPEATPVADDADPENEGTDPDEITPTKAGRNRLPLNENDEVGRLAAAYKRRNRDWTLEQALTAAKEKLGLNKPAADPEAKAADPVSTLPSTIEAVNAKVAELVAQKKTAASELRLEDIINLDEQITELRDHRLTLREKAQQDQAKQAADYQRSFAESEARAIETYEFANKPDSPAGKRMVEIEEAMEETGDPRFFDANKPLLIAHMVAQELKIAPRSKKAAAAPTPVKTAPATPAPKKQVLPTGESRTTPATVPVNNDADRISKIQTPLELKAELRKYGIQM